ncbi:hypothetical protein Hanom_Chr07g00668901 [Helianthus anomalus]
MMMLRVTDAGVACGGDDSSGGSPEILEIVPIWFEPGSRQVRGSGGGVNSRLGSRFVRVKMVQLRFVQLSLVQGSGFGFGTHLVQIRVLFWLFRAPVFRVTSSWFSCGADWFRVRSKTVKNSQTLFGTTVKGSRTSYFVFVSGVFGQIRSNSLKPSQTCSTRVNSVDSVNSVNLFKVSTLRAGYYRTDTSKSHVGHDITKSYLAIAHGNPG